jgi:hypothetical protein
LSMKLPFSRIVTGKPEVSWIVLYYAVLLLVCLYWMLRKEKPVLRGECWQRPESVWQQAVR